VWILSTDSFSDLTLETLSKPTIEAQCCWADDSTMLEKKIYLNGIARIIKYYDSTGIPEKNLPPGSKPEYIMEMWEGEVKRGSPVGFTRLIDPKKNYSFIGYIDENFNYYGTTLLFGKDKLEDMGTWEKVDQNDQTKS